MSHFKLYQAVIDSEMAEHDVSDEAVEEGIDSIRKWYSRHTLKANKNARPKVNYDEPYLRCAYLYLCATTHTELIAYNFRRTYDKCGKIPTEGDLKVCCLGGGPGTDAIGLLKVLREKSSNCKVETTVVDYYEGWGKVVQRVVDNISAGGLGDSYHRQVTPFFVKANLLEPFTSKVKEVVQSADVITLLKFISVVAEKDDSASKMIQEVFTLMKRGSILLFVDNAGGGFYQMVKELAPHNNMKVIYGPYCHVRFVNRTVQAANVDYMDFVSRFTHPMIKVVKVSVSAWMKT